MGYQTALAFFVHTRADDATDAIRILCAMATGAHLLWDAARRDQTIEVAADLASDGRLKRRHRPD
jgi:hypothetical protein